jgi:adenosylhomocysteine nucleosidase
MGKTVILAAMREELAPLIALSQESFDEKVFDGITFYLSDTLVLACTGVGKVNAARVTQSALSRFSVKEIIIVGVCGALNENLEVMDIVIANDCVTHDIDVAALGVFTRGEIPFMKQKFFNSDPDLIKKLTHATMHLELPVKFGRVATGDQFIASKSLREEIRNFFAAEVVDMESAAVFQVCALNEVSCGAIRVVSDKADATAPLAFTAVLEEGSRLAAEVILAYRKNFT